MFADKAQEKKNLLFKACYRGKVRANPFWGGAPLPESAKSPSTAPVQPRIHSGLILCLMALQFPAKTPVTAQAGRFKGMGFLLAEFLQVFW